MITTPRPTRQVVRQPTHEVVPRQTSTGSTPGAFTARSGSSRRRTPGRDGRFGEVLDESTLFSFAGAAGPAGCAAGQRAASRTSRLRPPLRLN
jgi:hypothetical protein